MPSNLTGTWLTCSGCEAEQGLNKARTCRWIVLYLGEKKAERGLRIIVCLEVWMKLSRGYRGVFAISDRASSMISIHCFHLQLTLPEFTRVFLAIQPNVVNYIRTRASVLKRKKTKSTPDSSLDPCFQAAPKTLAAE